MRVKLHSERTTGKITWEKFLEKEAVIQKKVFRLDHWSKPGENVLIARTA